MGADGLVLAAETAIGKNPKECVLFLKKILKTYKLSKFRLIKKMGYQLDNPFFLFTLEYETIYIYFFYFFIFFK